MQIFPVPKSNYQNTINEKIETEFKKQLKSNFLKFHEEENGKTSAMMSSYERVRKFTCVLKATNKILFARQMSEREKKKNQLL